MQLISDKMSLFCPCKIEKPFILKGKSGSCHLTLNQGVQGSSPWRRIESRKPSFCAGFRLFFCVKTPRFRDESG